MPDTLQKAEIIAVTQTSSRPNTITKEINTVGSEKLQRTEVDGDEQPVGLAFAMWLLSVPVGTRE